MAFSNICIILLVVYSLGVTLFLFNYHSFLEQRVLQQEEVDGLSFSQSILYEGYYKTDNYIVVFDDFIPDVYRDLLGYEDVEQHELAHYYVEKDYYHYCVEYPHLKERFDFYCEGSVNE